DINANTSKAAGLVACPSTTSAEPEPPSRGEEPLLSVHIEALLGRPTIRSASRLEFDLTPKPISVRQDKTADPNVATRTGYGLLGVANDRFVTLKKRVPRLNATAVEVYTNWAGITCDEAMKHHAEVGIDALEVGEEGLIAWSIAGATEVDFAPDHERP